jgi:uncharacterized membrane protein YdjX (TVP38/TMEM64 family)
MTTDRNHRFLPAGKTAALMAMALLGGLGWYGAQTHDLDAGTVAHWLETTGIWGPLIFAAIYAVATMAWVPATVVTVIGGALFGPVWGTIYNLAGATLGAGLAFIVARYAARDWIRERSGERLNQVLEGVEAQGWRFVAFSRLISVLPFSFVNCALGLTRVRFTPYLSASALFMIPSIAAQTYAGYVGRDAMGSPESTPATWLLASTLVGGLLFVPGFVRSWRLRKSVS